MSAKLNPEQAAKVLNRDLFNLIKKAEAGKVLTSGERAIVQAYLDGDGDATGAKAWAQNQVELAEALGVTRMTLNRWSKIKRNPPPGAESDGRYNVVEWKRWMRATGRGGKLDGDDVEDERPRLEAKRLLLVNEKLEFELARLRGEYLDRNEVIAEVSQACIAIKRELYRMAAHAAPQVAGLPVAEIELRLREAVDEALQQLHSGKWST